jgi:PhzF family phenazine biosynthesis protein
MRIYIVDAFTDTMYQGNPAAVCILDSFQTDVWMQKVANEMNLSETAFVNRTEEDYILRWFTPESEVDLCGHATLASAHVLWKEENCLRDLISFQTKSGLITTERTGALIHMNFPLEIATDCEATQELIDGLGVPMQYVGRNRMDYLIEVENEDIVKGLEPNFNILKKVDARGIIVTSKSDSESSDFVSRCFYPAVGVNEDPVTGSAHCCLGPYWGKKLHKSNLHAIQLSNRRGVLDLNLHGGRIIISGQAVTTLKGELLIEN